MSRVLAPMGAIFLFLGMNSMSGMAAHLTPQRPGSYVQRRGSWRSFDDYRVNSPKKPLPLSHDFMHVLMRLAGESREITGGYMKKIGKG